jgi:parvulin-like peptidyl-prolyl isomerase
MARKREEQASRALTRRQIARSKKEQEQLRIIYMGLGLVGLLIVAVLGFGLLQTYVFEPNSPVATVNGAEIRTGDYQKRVKYERFLLDSQLNQIQQQLATLPQAAESEDQFSQLLRNQYTQFANQLLQQRSSVDRLTLDEMEDDILIEAEAAKRNITVSEEEVTELINQIVANQAGGLTEQAASETSTARAEASATAAEWTPTPTFTPSPTLTATTEVTGTGEITPTATPADTPTPAPTPTFTIIQGDDLTNRYNEWINSLAEATEITEAEYRSYIRKNLLREKLSEAIGNETPKTAEHTEARHILVATEEEAQDVVDRLKAGEDFADLAAELSLDTSSAPEGGNLGFSPPGRYVEPVEEAISSLPIGQVSEPVESQFGWHIIEVLNREERELSPTDYSQQQRLAYQNWLDATRQTAQIEDFWSPDKAPDDDFALQPS